MSRARPLPAIFVVLSRIASAGVLSCAVGCDNPEPKTALSYTDNARRAYEQAMNEFDSKAWVEATQLFREVKRKYAYSKYARLAELRLADIDFEGEKYADAIRAYKQFVHDHRSDADEVSYARSKVAEAQYREINEGLLLPSAEERDQGSIESAYKELRGYLHDYPDSKESIRMRELLDDVTTRLIRHELYVARFYLHRDNYDAAVARILFAIKSYAASEGPLVARGLEPEALVLLGETYLKMHKWRDAREAFDAVLARYPTSAQTVQASNYLAFMKERGV